MVNAHCIEFHKLTTKPTSATILYMKEAIGENLVEFHAPVFHVSA
jgi:hypothetical protein